MPSRGEILAVYEAGPDALVAWVEQVTKAHQRQVAELVAQIEQLVDAHQRELASLTARIEQLEARLNKDSHNSMSFSTHYAQGRLHARYTAEGPDRMMGRSVCLGERLT